MMFPRLPCVFHPGETLTNFCTQPNCLLPLCPTCIKIHTGEHTAQRTSPAYEHINHLLGQVDAELRRCARTVECDLEEVRRLGAERERWRAELLEQVSRVREEVERVVGEWWEDVVGRIEESFREGGQYQAKAQQFDKVLAKQVAAFGRLQDSLYSGKAMRTVIKFKSDDTVKKTELSHSIVTEFLGKCRDSSLSVQVHPDLRGTLRTTLDSSSICSLSAPSPPDLDLEPVDITNSLEFPSESKNEAATTPSNARSRRTESEERRQRGIRLIGLETQFEQLDRTKKALLSRSSRLGAAAQKENLSAYRSIRNISQASSR